MRERSFGDDLFRYMDEVGIQTYAQLSRESGVREEAIIRLRWGGRRNRLSGRKIAPKLPDKLIPIIRVFIRKGAITSTTEVEEWINKLPLGCLDEKGYEQIRQEAKKELELAA